MKTIITALLLVSVQSCQYSDNSSISGVNDNQCNVVKKQCVGGVYDEWFQDNGELACSCFGKIINPEPNF